MKITEAEKREIIFANTLTKYLVNELEEYLQKNHSRKAWKKYSNFRNTIIDKIEQKIIEVLNDTRTCTLAIHISVLPTVNYVIHLYVFENLTFSIMRFQRYKSYKISRQWAEGFKHHVVIFCW